MLFRSGLTNQERIDAFDAYCQSVGGGRKDDYCLADGVVTVTFNPDIATKARRGGDADEICAIYGGSHDPYEGTCLYAKGISTPTLLLEEIPNVYVPDQNGFDACQSVGGTTDVRYSRNWCVAPINTDLSRINYFKKAVL